MKHTEAHRGFTLIEFVVIISIFAIMAGIALVNFAGFRSNVGVTNLAHDIALTIRQAQVFGWSTQTDITGAGGTIQFNNNTPEGDPERYADGVYFKYENGSFAKEFILYAKGDSTVGYEAFDDTPGTLDKTIDTIKIQGGSILEVRSSDTKQSLLLGPNKQIPQSGTVLNTSFSIAFSRPHPEAIFPNNANPGDVYLALYVGSDDTAAGFAEKVITISRFGEIAVQ